MEKSIAVLDAQGVQVRVLVSSRETGGKYTICEVATTGAVSIPVHQHRYEDLWCHVLEGAYSFELEGHAALFAAGSAVAVPRLSRCGIHSETKDPGRLLVVAYPGGLDMFFGDAGAALQLANAPLGDRLQPVLDKHGIDLASTRT